MPLLYASDGQVNALIPFGIAVNTQHQIVVQRGGSNTNPAQVTIAPAGPAVFTRDQSGGGQGLVLNAAARIVDASDPAAAGDAVVIYCTGLGEVSPPVQEGMPAPADPLSRVTGSVSVTIGGKDAQVIFAGLAPGFAGLYQVNAIVPSGITPASGVDLAITVSGQASQPVTIGVR
jgi:uncharacterized protein (TIGR03437 family)